MAESLRFDGRVVIVTGAGRGLGRAYARLLAACGAHVVVNDLGVDATGAGSSPEPSRAVVAEIEADGGVATADHSDNADIAAAEALTRIALAITGRIDGLVNNAGVFPAMKAFEDTPPDEFAHTWRVNCGGAFNLCRAVLPHMRAAAYGRIVNTVSIQGLYGAATSVSYASSKAAVQGLTLSLAAAVAGSGVTANAISPGGFTRMVDGGGRDPALLARLQEHLAPELAAPMVAWLCHPDCTENGEIFQAFAGRFSRTLIGEPGGAWDFAPTLDSVAKLTPTLMRDGPVSRAENSATRAGAVMMEAEALRAKN